MAPTARLPLGLQTLSDPKGVQPTYAPAPVVRIGVTGLSAADSRLATARCQPDEKTLQQLNARIAVEGLDAKSRRRLPPTKRVGEVIQSDAAKNHG